MVAEKYCCSSLQNISLPKGHVINYGRLSPFHGKYRIGGSISHLRFLRRFPCVSSFLLESFSSECRSLTSPGYFPRPFPHLSIFSREKDFHYLPGRWMYHCTERWNGPSSSARCTLKRISARQADSWREGDQGVQIFPGANMQILRFKFLLQRRTNGWSRIAPG